MAAIYPPTAVASTRIRPGFSGECATPVYLPPDMGIPTLSALILKFSTLLDDASRPREVFATDLDRDVQVVDVGFILSPGDLVCFYDNQLKPISRRTQLSWAGNT